MPILKNGEKYVLTPADKSKIRERLQSRFPAVFKMPPEWFQHDQYNPGRIIRPPAVNIPAKSVILSNGEYATWVYAKTFKIDPKTQNLIPDKPSIRFTTEKIVGENEMDLLFYLLFCCPLLAGSPHSNGKQSFYVLEDKVADASVYVERRKAKTIAEYEITMGLASARIREIALAYDIPNAFDPNTTIVEIQDALLKMLERSNNYEKFVEKMDLKEEIEIKAQANYLQSKGSLIYTPESGWVLLDNNGRPAAEIGKAKATKSPMDSLIHYCLSDSNKLKDLMNHDDISYKDLIKDEEEEKPVAITNKKNSFSKKKTA